MFSGQWTLKKAKDEKDRLEALRREGEDPRTLKSEQRIEQSKVRGLFTSGRSLTNGLEM